jgi:hypothetical protein
MKPSAPNTSPAPDRQADRPSGRRALMLAPILVLLGVALAGIWFKYVKPGTGRLAAGPGDIRLSDYTREQLNRLRVPVEIRFYAVLPPESAPESLRDFSGRADRLLSEFQGANESQIRVVRNLSTATTNVDAASADGIQAFNLEKGDACFLGITVASGGRKEVLARIQPEWEPALESDLARAILRVTATPANSIARQAQNPPISPETTNVIRRLIPDVPNTSLEEGSQRLRGAAAGELVAAGAEAEKQLELAKQQLADAQNSGSEAQQQAALKHLQEVQFEQTEKIRAIAARLQEELGVFEQMKTATPGNGVR